MTTYNYSVLIQLFHFSLSVQYSISYIRDSTLYLKYASVIHIHVSILYQVLSPIRLLQNIEQSSLYYTVCGLYLFLPHVIFSSVIYTSNSMIIPILKMGKLNVNNVKGFVQVRTPSEAVLRHVAQPLPRLPSVPKLWAQKFQPQ